MGNSKTKKNRVAIWVSDNQDLDNISDLLRIAKSTANTITANATTNSYDYIDQEKATTELDSYAYSMEHDIATYKGNADYEWAFEKFYYGDVGDAAKGTVLVVFMDHEDTAGVYKAFASKATFTVSSADYVSGVINMQISFNGDPVFGVVSGNGTPTFTKAPEKPSIVQSGNNVTIATATAGATIYYTTDGSDPINSATKETYSAAIAIEEDTNFKAVAKSQSGNAYSRIVKFNADYTA